MSISKAKKGDQVVLVGFTGMNLGVFSVSAASKEEIQIVTSDGRTIIFDRKTGVQTNSKHAKYANRLVLPADAPPPREKKPQKPKKEKAPVQPTPEPDEDEEPEEKKPKKSAKKYDKKAKKPAPPKEDEDEDWEDADDDEDYEDIEDDDE